MQIMVLSFGNRSTIHFSEVKCKLPSLALIQISTLLSLYFSDKADTTVGHYVKQLLQSTLLSGAELQTPTQLFKPARVLLKDN